MWTSGLTGTVTCAVRMKMAQNCEEAVGVPDSPPAIDPDLDEELYQLTGHLVRDTASASPDRYNACMSAAGYPIDSTREQLVASFAGQRAASNQPPTAAERSAAVADATCRRSGYEQVMAKLAGQLTQFKQRHRDRLAALAYRPAQLQAQAQQAAQRIKLSVDWV